MVEGDESSPLRVDNKPVVLADYRPLLTAPDMYKINVSSKHHSRFLSIVTTLQAESHFVFLSEEEKRRFCLNHIRQIFEGAPFQT